MCAYTNVDTAYCFTDKDKGIDKEDSIARGSPYELLLLNFHCPRAKHSNDRAPCSRFSQLKTFKEEQHLQT